MGYLYAVQMNIYGYPFQPIKIGMSNDPNVRANSYNSGPFPTTWLGSWEEEDAAAAERQLHIKFKDYRLTGEWFYPKRGLVQYVERKTGYPVAAMMMGEPTKAHVEFEKRFVRLFPLGIESIEREWDRPGHVKPCSDRLFAHGMANLDALERENNPLIGILH